MYSGARCTFGASVEARFEWFPSLLKDKYFYLFVDSKDTFDKFEFYVEEEMRLTFLLLFYWGLGGG